jgi:hypothetical protein
VLIGSHFSYVLLRTHLTDGQPESTPEKKHIDATDTEEERRIETKNGRQTEVGAHFAR